MYYLMEADAEFLRVRVWGRDTDRPPSEFCDAVLRESRARQRERILIELDQEMPLSAVSQYELVNRLPEIGFTARERIALFHRSEAMRRANDFINVLADNHGVNVRNFGGMDEALAWLRDTH
jgi:hypothetical protein